MTNIVFVDVETTSLRPDRHAWEIALITEEDKQSKWMIQWEDLDLPNADPQSLRIGGFYDRHPQAKELWEVPTSPVPIVFPEKSVARWVEEKTREAVLCGVNIQFDALTMDRMLRRHGLIPAWHHRLACVRNIAAGWLSSQDLPMAYDELVNMPSPELSKLCGVDPPAPGVAHTALGDAQWASEWFYRLVLSR